MSSGRPQGVAFGPYVLIRDERLLLRDGEPVALTPKALETLAVLVEHAGHVVRKEDLLQRVWPDVIVEDATLAQNISTIRKTLGLRADGGPYVETVPKLGYRFAAPVTVVMPAAASQPAVLADELVVTPRRHVVPRLRLKWTIAGIVVVLVVAIGVAASRGRRVDPATPPRTLAILPFKNVQGDPTIDHLAFPLADAVIGRLSTIPQIIVRPAAYVEKYRGQVVDPHEVARALLVDGLVTGSYLKDGERLRIAVELADVRRGEIVWRDTLEVTYDRLMTVQDVVARRLLDSLRLALAPEESRRLAQSVPSDPHTYELYLKGADLNARHEWSQAIPLLQQATAVEPSWAEAWSHLGVAYYGHGAFQGGGAHYVEQALQAYRTALSLNPDLLDARIAMAMYFTENGQIEQAVRLLQETLRINPRHGPAYWWLGYAYRYAGLLDESLRVSETAHALDPAGGELGVTTNTYLYLGQVERFIASLREDGSARTAFYRGLGALYQNDRVRAAAEFARAYSLDPSLIHARIGKAMRHALVGERAEGLSELARIEAHDAPADGELTYKVAQAYAMLDAPADALRLLERAIDQDFFCHPYIARDVLLAPLHGEEAFARVLGLARARQEDFRRAFPDIP